MKSTARGGAQWVVVVALGLGSACAADTAKPRDEGTKTGSETGASSGAGPGGAPSDDTQGATGDDNLGSGAGSNGDSDSGIAANPGEPWTGGDTADLGPYAEGLYSQDLSIPSAPTSDADLTTHVWAPSDDGGTTPAAGPFALVVYHPGFGTSWNFYQELAAQIASYGYVVIGVNHYSDAGNHMRNAEQSLRAMEFMGSEWEFKASVDATRIATAGHSMGGKVAFLAAALDNPNSDRIKAVIGWDPVDASFSDMTIAPSVAPELMGQIHAPLLILGAPAGGCSPEGDNHDNYFADAASPATHIVFPMGTHMDWVDVTADGGLGVVGGVGGLFCGQSGSAGAPAVHRVTQRAQVAFLKKHLDAMTGLDDMITGSVMQAEGDLVTLDSK